MTDEAAAVRAAGGRLYSYLSDDDDDDDDDELDDDDDELELDELGGRVHGGLVDEAARLRDARAAGQHRHVS